MLKKSGCFYRLEFSNFQPLFLYNMVIYTNTEHSFASSETSDMEGLRVIMDDNVFNDESEIYLDALTYQIECQPTPRLMCINFKRLSEMLRAKDLISLLISDTDNDVPVEFKINSKMYYGSLSVITEDFPINNPKLFALAVAKADNFEIYSLLNKKICFNMIFYNIFIGV